MKKLLLLLALGLTIATAGAQKLVIGSKVPDLKGIQWLTPPPAVGKPTVVEFYNPDNATCVRFFPKLAQLKTQYGDRINTVVLTMQSGAAIDALVQSSAAQFAIGIDPDGKTYQGFNVQYLPYTVVVNSKGELHWQGNLGNITDATLQGVR